MASNPRYFLDAGKVYLLGKEGVVAAEDSTYQGKVYSFGEYLWCSYDTHDSTNPDRALTIYATHVDSLGSSNWSIDSLKMFKNMAYDEADPLSFPYSLPSYKHHYRTINGAAYVQSAKFSSGQFSYIL